METTYGWLEEGKRQYLELLEALGVTDVARMFIDKRLECIKSGWKEQDQ